MDTRELTPGDRRELRSLIKRQFDVLRKDVKRRQSELESEVESELLRRYQQQDERVEQARRELGALHRDYELAVQKVLDALHETDPNLRVQLGYAGQLAAEDRNRTQLRRAAIAAIPQQIADAQTRLDQQEINLLRELTVGALDSDLAQQFLGSIPTVGELVPRARLASIEAGDTR